MKKYLLIMFVLALVLGGAAIFLFLQQTAGTPDTNNSGIPGNDLNLGGTQTAKMDINLNQEGNYDLVIYSDEEFSAFELELQTGGQFSVFTPNPVYDAVLMNTIDSTGAVSIALGKLNNSNSVNSTKTSDGGFIVGYFALNPDSATAPVVLNQTKSSVVVGESNLGFDSYEESLP